jgi:hypothetical protein
MPGGKGSHRDFSPQWEEEGPAGLITRCAYVLHLALLRVIVVGGSLRPFILTSAAALSEQRPS